MRDSRSTHVTATDLAQMGVCETQVVLDAKFGRRRARSQEAAARRGDHAHDTFHRQAVAIAPSLSTSKPTKPWCFIATVVFSAASAETVILRAFRDAWLRPTRIGRAVIWRYYRVSPAIAKLLVRRPLLRAIAWLVLQPLVTLASLLLCARAHGVRRR